MPRPVCCYLGVRLSAAGSGGSLLGGLLDSRDLLGGSRGFALARAGWDEYTGLTGLSTQ